MELYSYEMSPTTVKAAEFEDDALMSLNREDYKIID
jgi:hypothetical protein